MRKFKSPGKLFVIAMGVIAMGVFVISGCDKKEEDSKSKDETEKPAVDKGDSKEDDKDDKQKDTAQKEAPKEEKVPAPNPLPKADADGVVAEFPAFVPVSAPQKFSDELKKAEEALKSSSFQEKRKGRDALNKIIKENEKDSHLARYLMSQKESSMIRRGVTMWKKMKDTDEYVAVLVSLFGNPSDRVRADAVSGLGWGVKKEQREQAAPFVKKLLADTSCIVRRQSLDWLIREKRDLGVPKKEILAGVDDECPVHKARALEALADAVDKESPDKGLIDKVTKFASESPFYHVRCQALKALGDMKVKNAEKLMAKALDYPAGTALVVYYLEDKSPYTFNLAESTIPECGASALSALHGKKYTGSRTEKVKNWRTEMAKKRMAAKPPKNFCISKNDCKKDEEVCLKAACVPIKKAEKDYWKYELLKRCADKQDRPAWKNFTDEVAVASGFGLHWNAGYQIRKFLSEKDGDAFKKNEEKNRKRPCPKK